MSENIPINQPSPQAVHKTAWYSLPPQIKDFCRNSFEYIKIRWSKSPFSTVERRARFYEWLLHNIIYGFACIWIPSLFLAFFGKFKFSDLFLSGDLPMFAVTISAVSSGFFVKESQVSLRKTEMLTYVGLMLILSIGIVTRIALTASTIFPSPSPISMAVVNTTTCGLVLLAIILNYKLFTLELQSIDPNDVKDKLAATASALSAQAAGAIQVDNINL